MCARYYPNGNNHPKKDTSIGPGGSPNTIDENGISRWLEKLYNGTWSEDDQQLFEQRYAIPGYQQYLDYLLDKHYREVTFDLYGITYNDIRDPRNVRGASSTSALVRYGLNFVSDNVRRLYR